MGFRVWGLGFRGLGFRVRGLGFRVLGVEGLGVGLRVSGEGLQLQESEFCGLMVPNCKPTSLRV